MHRFANLLAGLSCLVPCARTQFAAPTAKEAKSRTTKDHFLPHNYSMELRANIGELTQIGLVDELRKSPVWGFVHAALNRV